MCMCENLWKAVWDLCHPCAGHCLPTAYGFKGLDDKKKTQRLPKLFVYDKLKSQPWGKWRQGM